MGTERGERKMEGEREKVRVTESEGKREKAGEKEEDERGGGEEQR